MKNKYNFNPLDHGFEPISLYPELHNYFPNKNRFVKIVCYDFFNGLVYWYKLIDFNVGFTDDERIKIYSGTYDFRTSDVGSNACIYTGLITSDNFAKKLLKHLLGTTKNSSVRKDGKERYNNKNLGLAMRSVFPQYYK